MKTKKSHEPVSVYASGVYVSLITVIQGFALAALLWAIVDRPKGGMSIYDELMQHDVHSIPYVAIIKGLIAFSGIITIWHSYAINAQFQSYSLTLLDSVIPFLFAFFEFITISLIETKSIDWFSAALLAIQANGILGYWNMKYQMENGHASELMKGHFGTELGLQIYKAIIRFAVDSKKIMIQSFMCMFIALLIAIGSRYASLLRSYYIDVWAVVLAYTVAVLRLAKNDLHSYLNKIDSF